MNTEINIRTVLATAVETALAAGAVTCLPWEPVITSSADVEGLGLKDVDGKLHFAWIHSGEGPNEEKWTAGRAGLSRRRYAHEIHVCRGITAGNQAASYDGVRQDVATVLSHFASMPERELLPAATLGNAVQIDGELATTWSLIKFDPIGFLHHGVITVRTVEALRRA